ncbi:N-acetylmuramoyl-L-alanine amidase [Nonomuraea turcica]|uniref:N-acetylmuramoyl-L-alanine amidase n=1 Tax=Nonomuraea sp. G32 TaxID=3067274 RepID=UPI00273B1A0D|nr:N-acetylmuramoyl-L-alanine amidase [Nonomuraea sp. G32]MDP4503344.1 N-acetylmuramoyl-L-alanine amidase [Nonomuraea sp. G32]
MQPRFRRSALLLAGALLPLPLLMGQATAAADPIAGAFAKAATTYDVPRDLLVSLAYAETHLDGHDGAPSASGGYGVMHLVSNPKADALARAATLTGQGVAKLKSDDAANIAGGAAVLRAHADDLGVSAAARKDPAKWYQAVAKYGNASSPDVARLYADTVYDLMAEGVQATTPDGETVTVQPRAVEPERGPYANAKDLDGPAALAANTDYPGARWVPAHSSNYAVSNRPTSDTIDRIVIHVTQGSYAGTISWFQNGPRANPSSAHYVIRSSDGAITQMVREKDRAFHAGSFNRRSVGIEHEGFVDNATWFTDAMYRASAALTRNIADRYGIPKDRTHIVGHHAVPGTDHTDPGPHWNWTTYMQYVTGSGGGGGANPHTPESVCGSGYKVIDSAVLGTAGTVFLLYNTANGNNCVATIKKTSLGTATATSAYLEVEGKPRVTDSGNFAYYAGPVRAAAADKCVKWGGKAGTATYTSPFEHCG